MDGTEQEQILSMEDFFHLEEMNQEIAAVNVSAKCGTVYGNNTLRNQTLKVNAVGSQYILIDEWMNE